MKTQLEMVYLMNVLQYFEKFNDIITFLFCNKKCKEAIDSTRINPLIRYKCEDKSLIIPKGRYINTKKLLFKQIEIFPKLETIECDGKFIKEIREKYSELKQYYFKIHHCKYENLKYIPIKNIRKLDIILNKNEYLDFSHFNISWLKITFIEVSIHSIYQIIYSIPKNINTIIIITNKQINNIIKLFPYSKCTIQTEEGCFNNNEFNTNIKIMENYDKNSLLYLPKETIIKSDNEYNESMLYCENITCTNVTGKYQFSNYLKELSVDKLSTNLNYLRKLDILDINIISKKIELPHIINSMFINSQQIDINNIININSIQINNFYLYNHLFVLSNLPTSINELHVIKSILPLNINLLPQLTFLSLFECKTNELILPSSLKRFETESLTLTNNNFNDLTSKLTKVMVYDDHFYHFQNPQLIESLEFGNMNEIDISQFICLKDLIIVSSSFKNIQIPKTLTRFELEYCTIVSSLNISESNITDLYIGYSNLHTITFPTSIKNCYLRQNHPSLIYAPNIDNLYLK
ncbi:hypothetical protein ENU1_202860 [Entamoeba nuttalli P19]|uniref:Uncharacterized protein n=1 Tax=Entamoeba nuttalli (strain P19) TaxID=1076696 RepID=K2H487_ENTNP|nr:hypothetical protein ENU1_202860 [Entamoeba nuttalli P19]EKE37279.1 hypothetical protein ENU1_202860 [Entamoeba nuttalli P19]|eukprot:XP_008860377.1 hypothetical protein ENU1_202860 [Entamoeba nuttalli P19]